MLTSTLVKSSCILCVSLFSTLSFAQIKLPKSTVSPTVAVSINPQTYCFEPTLNTNELEAYISQASEPASSKDCKALAYFRLGELAEQHHEYTTALNHYRQVLLIDPGHGRAAAAQMRIKFLESNQNTLSLHQRFELIRSKPNLNSNELISMAQETLNLPSDYTRDDIVLSIITTLIEVLKQPKLSIDISLALARGLQASTNSYVRTRAYELAYSAMLTLNAWPQIQRELLLDKNISSSLRLQIHRDQQRFWLHRITHVILTIFASSLGYLAILCIYQRRWQQWLHYFQNIFVWIFIGTATVGGFGIAEVWEHHSGVLFLYMGMFLIVNHIWVSTWRATLKPQPLVVRISGSLIAVASLLAAAYWVLEHTSINGIPMLDEFGL